jgi:hypothetical protein
MRKDLFDALEALCMMWQQYCDDDWGHMCMIAGEYTEEVLLQYELIIPRKGTSYAYDVNWDKLETYRKQAHDTN